jgi:hypothetical protein
MPRYAMLGTGCAYWSFENEEYVNATDHTVRVNECYLKNAFTASDARYVTTTQHSKL